MKVVLVIRYSRNNIHGYVENNFEEVYELPDGFDEDEYYQVAKYDGWKLDLDLEDPRIQKIINDFCMGKICADRAFLVTNSFWFKK